MLAVSGRQNEARDGLDRLSRLEATRYVPAYPRALLALALGDREGAYRLIDRAVIDRAHSVAFLKVDPGLDPIRKDPRFAQIVAAAAPRR